MNMQFKLLVFYVFKIFLFSLFIYFFVIAANVVGRASHAVDLHWLHECMNTLYSGGSDAGNALLSSY